MHKLTLLALGLATLLLPILGVAQSKPAAQPPVIDRELFFGDPEITGAQLSPDGRFMSFMKPYKGTRNIWVKTINAPFASAKPMTADTTRPVGGYFWSRDGKYLLFVQDKGGDENYNVFAVDPAEPLKAGQAVPDARDLTGLKGVRVQIYEVPKNDPNVMYVGLNDRDKAWHDLYKLTIATGEKTLLRKNLDRISGWNFDWNYKLRLATRSAEDGSTEVLRVDDDKLTKIYSTDIYETSYIAGPHKDNKRFYVVTNKGDRDLQQLVLLDPATGTEELVETDPLKRVDFGGIVMSDLTHEPIYTAYTDDRLRRYWKDKSYQTDFATIQQKFPGADVYPGSSTTDERYWLVSVLNDTNPGETYLFDRKTKALTFQYKPRPNMPVGDLATMRVVRYKSSDGLEIPAYLTLPKGVAAKNLPLIIFPHGGPWARDQFGYNAYHQFLANRGYAVLSPNFRSSTGYGKKFLNSGNKEWGRKMQDDLTYGVEYLVAQGIADPKRVGIMGGSYGGYATLAGLAFTPDVYAGGVSIVGPSNLITLLNSIPPYWESIRKLFNERMGDPATPEGKAQLERQSPLNSATKIKAPLLVVQGANDPRVNKAESDQIVIALRDRGFPVEYIVAPDEGHGFARPVNNMAMLAAAEKFMAKHLGGRYQASMPANIAKRLTEITVNPKTVVLAKQVDASAMAPVPMEDLKPGKFAYKTTIQAGGQTMNMDKTTEIVADGDNWKVTESVVSPMGTMSDESWVNKKTLLPVKRTAKQGPATIEVAYSADKITGSMNMGTGAKPFDTKSDGPMFADGGGASVMLASLPIKEGYTTTYRNFDLQTRKGKLFTLTVAGKESVTVPAGTFDAYKLEVKPADGTAGGQTIWVAADGSRRVLKEQAVIPSMGGATMIAELQQ